MMCDSRRGLLLLESSPAQAVRENIAGHQCGGKHDGRGGSSRLECERERERKREGVMVIVMMVVCKREAYAHLHWSC